MDFLLGLKERGLDGVEFVVSDDHAGLIVIVGNGRRGRFRICRTPVTVAGTERRRHALVSAPVERFCDGTHGRALAEVVMHMMDRYDELQSGFCDSRFVAAMLAELDDEALMASAQGFAQGVRILEADGPTEEFSGDERRSLSLLAGMAEGELPVTDARIDLAGCVEIGVAMRHGAGS